MNTFETMDIEEKVVDAIRTCYDPEIPVNIYELGLIYRSEWPREREDDPHGSQLPCGAIIAYRS